MVFSTFRSATAEAETTRIIAPKTEISFSDRSFESISTPTIFRKIHREITGFRPTILSSAKAAALKFGLTDLGIRGATASIAKLAISGLRTSDNRHARKSIFNRHRVRAAKITDGA